MRILVSFIYASGKVYEMTYRLYCYVNWYTMVLVIDTICKYQKKFSCSSR